MNYIVKKGDTLPRISRALYGTYKHFLEIARVNKIEDLEELSEGQELLIPDLKPSLNTTSFARRVNVTAIEKSSSYSEPEETSR